MMCKKHDLMQRRNKKHVLNQKKKHVLQLVLQICIKIINTVSTKLTLTIDESVIKRAKEYARNKNRSLSNLIENYLKALTNDAFTKENEVTSLVKNFKGSFKMPEDFNYKKELSERLTEKYL